MRPFFFSFVLLTLCACTYSVQEKATFNHKIKRFMQQHHLHMSASESGLYFQIDKVGTGRKIRLQDSLMVSYTLQSLDGKQLDAQSKPVGISLMNTIGAWQEALVNQQVGVKLQLICPPQLAYGKNGMGKIGPDQTLYFQLQVVEAK
ncbi:MAG: hypothetical protein RLZZ301_288 [Bacteroidota bacterium]|jgi:FKBP-type peptidyl-prolyl cis-trans isomerase FkpA